MDVAEQATEVQPIAIEVQGAMALVTLDRPRALNALTVDMRARLAAALPRFSRDPQVYCVVIHATSPKAFSAGSDVREVIALAREDITGARRAFADEYGLNWHCECFSKPTISLIDGMVMGGGVGISLYGTHRVAGEGYSFAMPETMIGLFPDVGTAHVLGRLEGSKGLYLGLTGRRIGRADAYALGLVTHCIPASRFDEIRAMLKEAEPVDPVLDDRHQDPGPGELAPMSEVIDKTFSAPTVEEIVARLEATTGAAKGWAEGVVSDLRARSPMSLKITLRHIREAAARDLKGTLELDYRLAVRCLAGHDFAEGARAQLIDKDGKPAWRPSRLEDVTEAMVSAYFAPLGPDELILPTRADMQAARA